MAPSSDNVEQPFHGASLEVVQPADKLARQLSELRGDRRLGAGFLIGGLVLLAGGAAGVYSLLSGDYIPVVSSIAPGSGSLLVGTALTGSGVSNIFRSSQEIRQRTRQG